MLTDSSSNRDNEPSMAALLQQGNPPHKNRFLFCNASSRQALLAQGGSAMKEKGHGIVLDEKGQEQPKDKERARKANKTEPGRLPQQPVEKDDELQPLREKSGF
jgi:hypothetical protein